MKHFPEIVEIAWDHFVLGNDFTEEMGEVLKENMFLPWFLFNWIPLIKDDVSSKKIALQYLDKKGYTLSSYQRDFIEEICQSPYSFYAVLDVILDQQIRLKDIFLQTEHVVKEKSGTHYLKRGDIVFARVLKLEDQEITVGMAPYSVHSKYHLDLIDLRRTLENENKIKSLTPSLLEQYDEELRLLFFHLILEHHNSSSPSLQNTDGDPLQFCKVYFDLKIDPQEAFKKLMPLTLSHDPNEFLSKAKKDKEGNFQRIEFSWIKYGNKQFKEWKNTILGHITIHKNHLRIEVNSEKRGKKIQRLIKKYLKNDAVYQNTLIESAYQKAKSSQEMSSNHKKELEDFKSLPEVQKHLHQYLKSWIEIPLPALKGKTPREALRTKDSHEE